MERSLKGIQFVKTDQINFNLFFLLIIDIVAIIVMAVLVILFMWLKRGKKIIVASANENRAISPKGAVMVKRGGGPTFIITSNPHCNIAVVQVDGKSVVAIANYTFSEIKEDHTITAVLKPD